MCKGIGYNKEWDFIKYKMLIYSTKEVRDTLDKRKITESIIDFHRIIILKNG